MKLASQVQGFTHTASHGGPAVCSMVWGDVGGHLQTGNVSLLAPVCAFWKIGGSPLPTEHMFSRFHVYKRGFGSSPAGCYCVETFRIRMGRLVGLTLGFMLQLARLGANCCPAGNRKSHSQVREIHGKMQARAEYRFTTTGPARGLAFPGVNGLGNICQVAQLALWEFQSGRA